MIYWLGNHRKFAMRLERNRLLRATAWVYEWLSFMAVLIFPSLSAIICSTLSPWREWPYGTWIHAMGHSFLGQRQRHPRGKPTHSYSGAKCSYLLGIWNWDSDRMNKSVAKQRMLTQKKQPSYINGRAHRRKAQGTRSSLTWGLVVYLSWTAGKPLGIFTLWVDGFGFYSLQPNESLPKPIVNPINVYYNMTGLCDSAFTSECQITEKLLCICSVEGARLGAHERMREGGLCLTEIQGVLLCFYILEVVMWQQCNF